MNADEKKVYEEPTVTKVEFDFSDRIASSACSFDEDLMNEGADWCVGY